MTKDYVKLLRQFASRKMVLLVLVVCGGMLVLYLLCYYFLGFVSNPANRNKIEDILSPLFYKRINVESGSYAEFLRSLPLKKRGARVQLYKGGTARLQGLSYAVIDQELLSNDEQCADACMRLRAEYLYSQKI